MSSVAAIQKINTADVRTSAVHCCQRWEQLELITHCLVSPGIINVKRFSYIFSRNIQQRQQLSSMALNIALELVGMFLNVNAQACIHRWKNKFDREHEGPWCG